MLRWLYIQLIWLHPAPFRWRFGDDMLDDFDHGALRDKPRYFADAAASLARQWLLRPEFHHPEATAATTEASLQTAGVPLFHTIETYKPRPAALLHGGLLAILSILAAVILIGKGGGHAKPFLIGAHFSRSSLLPIDRNSVATSDLNSTVKPGPDPSEAWRKRARPYFFSMPVLRALDTDRDFTLSPWEIGNAPAALRNLDVNHAGKLTAEECGLRIDPHFIPPAMRAQLRRQFMSYHPVLAALDADHDGEISAREIDHAAAALKKLDHNHDGYLTAEELVPLEMAARVGCAECGEFDMKATLLIPVLSSVLLQAQLVSSPATPKFEVISIRRHTEASGPVQRGTATTDGFHSIGLPLFAIFQVAYAPPNQSGVLRGDLIAGAPGWLQDEAYDVVAKVDEADLADWRRPGMKQTMLRAMLQAMLAERCKVVIHHESKEVPVYNLVVAKGGPKFRQAETVDADELQQKPGGGGTMTGTNVRVVPGPSGIRYYGISMAILTQTILPYMTGRPVMDKTGLAGYYDLTLPDLKPPSMVPLPPPPGTAQPLNEPPPPPGADESIFTVLPAALGLRLEAAKGLVETLVVDHVERPSEN